jgi:hypothetical protein
MVLEDLTEMNASSCHEVSVDFPHHAGQLGPTHVAGRARRGLRRSLKTTAIAKAFGGVVAVCLCGLLAAAPALAQESVLSDVPVGPSIAAPQQTIEGDGYPAGTEWNQGGEFVQPDAQALPGDSFANQSAADPGHESLPGQIGGEPTIEGAAGEYVVGDLPKGLCSPATRCQRWTAQVDALMLWQGAIPSRPLYVDSVTKSTVLDANQAQPAVSVAPRYALIYHRDACRALEINYFQVQSFAGQATVYPGQNPYAMQNLLGLPFSDIDAAQVTTAGGIKSLEFNLRRSECDGAIRWLAGFRWVEWNQSMTVGDQFTDAGGLSGVEGAQINTGNNLYGGQVGADMMLWNAGNGIKFNGIAKGGVFYNHQAYQTTSVVSDRGFENTFTATADEPAFVGEVGFNGSIALTNWLSWRAGYTLFWLGGVATPANQLSVTNVGDETTGINSYSSVLLHGVTTGLEARW